jgi:UDP-glucose 4-epimerase
VSTLAWVVGRGGLLGSSVEHKIRSVVWCPVRPIVWDDLNQNRETIVEAVRGFRSRLAAEPASSWSIYWCAGKGVVGTPADRLAAETASLLFFLNQLGNALAEGSQTELTGQVFLASSAGGVYGGNTEHLLTEATFPRPISDYGRAKLEQEQVLRDWTRDRPTVSTLVGRFSNLYGPGQHLDKPQGLISHVSRCIIFNVPVRIYVPLDTIRDYLFAEDAAMQIVACMARLGSETRSHAQHITKIYSSQNETTVAGIIGVFRQIAKRHVRVVSGLVPVRSQQPARLHFRSTVWSDQQALPRTELLDGVSRVHRHQLALFQTGHLPPPVVGTPR